MSRKINMPKRFESVQNEATNGVQKSEIDLFELARLIVRRRRWAVSIRSLAVAATAAYLLLQPNQYTSRAIILPSGAGGNYSSLKAFVGMAAGTGTSEDNSSSLFPVIVKSGLVANAALAKDYLFKVDGQFEKSSLSVYYGIGDPDKLKKALRGATPVNA